MKKLMSVMCRIGQAKRTPSFASKHFMSPDAVARKSRALSAGVFVLILGACAKINEEAEEALALLVDLQKLVLANADEQKRELTVATQAVTRQKSEVARLRLGMLQSLQSNGGDESRAMTTLEPLLKGAPSPVRAVAIVLLAQLGERQRTLRDEKKRAEDLQQKLDALKALERSLLGRERKPAP